MQKVNTLLNEPKVTTFVVDFEAGLWQALRQVFTDPEIKGCAFHFGQALWRKCQEIGLRTAYESRDQVHKLLRKTFALPLLPPADIRPAFARIKEKGRSEQLAPFFAYVENTWLTNNVWAVDNWSVYGRSVRTNNDVEGWHNRLNRRAKKGNLSFYLLITLLFDEAKEVPMQCKLIKEKKLKRHQSKQTRATQGRLCAAWDRYGKKEISTSELLNECCRLYGPV